MLFKPWSNFVLLGMDLRDNGQVIIYKNDFYYCKCKCKSVARQLHSQLNWCCPVAVERGHVISAVLFPQP